MLDISFQVFKSFIQTHIYHPINFPQKYRTMTQTIMLIIIFFSFLLIS
jgi:hypothetical protein